jgi:hypothetical protein
MSVRIFSNAVLCFLPKAIRGGVAFLLLMVVYGGVCGQTLFNFQSNLRTANNKPLAYNIFLFVNWDGTAAARIAFKDPVTGKNRIVKLSLIDNKFPDNSDTDKVVNLMPFGDVFNENDRPEKSIVVPRFQFIKPVNYEGISTAAAKVYYSYDNKQWFAPISNTAKVLTDQKETTALVKLFFDKSEQFYHYYLNVGVPPIVRKEMGRKLFLITVAATEDPKIGLSTQRDLMSIQGFYPDEIKAMGIDLHRTELIGKDFTKHAVNVAINNLKPGPKDIVMFYYSGHGFRYTDDTSKYPRIALVASGSQSPDNDNLSLEDIYKRILKKRAWVSIVLADCCNEDYGSSPPIGPVQEKPEAAPGEPTAVNLLVWRSLFLPDKPLSVLACAAEKNQLAAGNEKLGGFFTHFMQTELQKGFYGKYSNYESSWVRILNNAKEYTRRQALTADCVPGGPCDGDRSLQRPAFKVVSVPVTPKIRR